MTGSIAVDVAIGLVFIFLLYSLLASILQEIVGTLIGLRARNLRKAIQRMLEDEQTIEKKGNLLIRQFVNLWEWFKRAVLKKEKGIVKEFYNQPVIKYLTSGKLFSKPSYLNPSDFSKAVMEVLKDAGIKKDGSLATNIEKIEKALEDDVDELGILGADTKKHIKSLLEDAEGDLTKFKTNLESWFNNTMARASGWYKKNTQLTLFVIGMFLAGTFNINTLEIAKLLSVDKDAREQMVQLASAYVESNPNAIADYQQSVTNATDSTKTPTDQKLDSLMKIKKNIELQAEEAQNILGFQPNGGILIPKDSIKSYNQKQADQLKKSLSEKQAIVTNDSLMAIVGFSSVFLAENTPQFYTIKKKKVTIKDGESSVTKYYADLNRWGFFWHNFWGYLITALAISLGAPFWFDMLNKLVKLRSSIQQGTANTNSQ